MWLAQQGWEVTAVDFSAVAIERGRELARQRDVSVDWQVADVTAYEPPADGVDLVLIAYLHLPAAEIAAVLSHARRAVRRGGRVLVVGHDVGNLSGGTGGPQDPDILLTPEAVVKELSGLRIRRAETARRPVTVEGRAVDALDTVVVAERC